MHARKLPTILELMESNVDDGLQPIHECRMGWCTQCSCNKSDVESRFGKVEYRSEPSIPPIAGKVLPCISTQAKGAEEFDKVKMLFEHAPNAKVMKKSTIFARLPDASEIGSQHKTLVVANGKLVVGQRELLTSDSVIVRNPKELAPGKHSEMVVAKGKFLKTYGQLPAGAKYEIFKDAKPVLAFQITEEVAAQWNKDGGKMYYRNGRETVEVFVGTTITENGKAITEDMAKRLEITSIAQPEQAPLPKYNPF